MTGLFIAISMYVLALAVIVLALGWSDAKRKQAEAEHAAELWRVRAQRQKERAEFWITEASANQQAYAEMWHQRADMQRRLATATHQWKDSE